MGTDSVLLSRNNNRSKTADSSTHATFKKDADKTVKLKLVKRSSQDLQTSRVAAYSYLIL
jgi:hypothetical protein